MIAKDLNDSLDDLIAGATATVRESGKAGGRGGSDRRGVRYWQSHQRNRLQPREWTRLHHESRSSLACRQDQRCSMTSTTAVGARTAKCERCKDEGWYFILPRGNPFAMRIEVLAQAMEKRRCTCEAGRAAIAKTGGA